MKVDGHTHTHYCPHGSGEETAKFIEKAIELGFDRYVLTEHAPLPRSFCEALPYEKELVQYFTMKETEFDDYIKEMHQLKRKYKDQIEIRVGFELDYLSEYIDWTRNLLREYQGYIEETVLSVHFLKGVDGWRCIDHTPEELEENVVLYHGNFQSVQKTYYETIKEAILQFQPSRIGHLSLCQKFQHYFDEGTLVADKAKNEVEQILILLKKKGIALDFNTAGIDNKYCLEPYPSNWIVKKAQKMGIPFIFGSDAHAVDEVGRSYSLFQSVILSSLG
ncbi:histidinol-phosphatase HisJ [Shimazuella alba]|uniref:Histidinol-phosphatase n=1 Tax=Shimazuella alba TaxID=2690964 RepID=A0A6I4VYF5_9BACL|nr:histidinol-phosphatase HisJ [Shimazuella alba]MXQ54960.1 histidinol-phosphatase HisJ [Shimazuella alba]